MLGAYDWQQRSVTLSISYIIASKEQDARCILDYRFWLFHGYHVRLPGASTNLWQTLHAHVGSAQLEQGNDRTSLCNLSLAKEKRQHVDRIGKPRYTGRVMTDARATNRRCIGVKFEAQDGLDNVF